MPDSSPLNIVFAGTPDFAARHLEGLIQSHHRLVGVYTQPDRPKGRGKKLAASPVKQVAMDAGLPVFQPASLKGEEEQRQLQELNPDIMVVVAYGLLLPQAVLDIPRLGCINVHASILPRWRGAAPIQRAIEAGDQETGITIMQMDAGLDTGDMLHKTCCPILADDSAADLHDRLAELGPPALLTALDLINRGEITPAVQDESLATYASKLHKAEGEIDWHAPAADIAQRVRAFNPFPTCYADLHTAADEVHRVKVQRARADSAPASQPPGSLIRADKQGLIVACGEGQLTIEQLQLAGKKPMDAAAFLNGFSALVADGAHFVVRDREQ